MESLEVSNAELSREWSGESSGEIREEGSGYIFIFDCRLNCIHH